MQCIDVRGGRAVPQPARELVERVVSALRADLDAAVGQVHA